MNLTSFLFQKFISLSWQYFKHLFWLGLYMPICQSSSDSTTFCVGTHWLVSTRLSTDHPWSVGIQVGLNRVADPLWEVRGGAQKGALWDKHDEDFVIKSEQPKWTKSTLLSLDHAYWCSAFLKHEFSPSLPILVEQWRPSREIKDKSCIPCNVYGIIQSRNQLKISTESAFKFAQIY